MINDKFEERVKTILENYDWLREEYDKICVQLTILREEAQEDELDHEEIDMLEKRMTELIARANVELRHIKAL